MSLGGKTLVPQEGKQSIASWLGVGSQVEEVAECVFAAGAERMLWRAVPSHAWMCVPFTLLSAADTA